MARLPILKARDVIRVLHKLGFVSIRQTGSHEVFKHPDGRKTSVPSHGGKEDVRHTLMHQILRQVETDYEEFMKWL